jgi:hypothetical protein
MSQHDQTEHEWQREQWEGEGQDSEARDLADAPHDTEWHKEQWEGEGQDDDPVEKGRPADEMGEGDSELSGHGHNPGGGKQFGEFVEEE